MGVLHQLNYLGQHGVLANFGGAELEGPKFVDRRAEHQLSGFLVHRHTFAGQHGLVHGGDTLSHFAVNRYLLARPHRDYVSHLHGFHRHVDFLSVPNHTGGVGAQTDQPPDSFRSTASGAGFQVASQKNQGDDDCGRVEVDVPSDAALGQKLGGQRAK